ncbi:MAG: hypothetical protein O2812_05860 [Chloroflexi bacterium]|nr:hypothetical protein [Chloroflexota bacterium]
MPDSRISSETWTVGVGEGADCIDVAVGVTPGANVAVAEIVVGVAVGSPFHAATSMTIAMVAASSG